ncbi:MAG TPA: CDP-diacylglycerol--glycerol-3-phosphate 3-phosphatidyltransferase [Terriglobia bacterium]|nr:CDP-diacylglycerol--glycerol-3-phosphate 3-phosphatidyltransferase [Terriglobia bacterium]
MSLPLYLTVLRIFFVPLLVVLLLTKGQNIDLWAVAVFLAAAGTDFLDGYLARRRSQVTRLGILLDPIADKLLISAAFISLVELQLVAAWIVVIIVGREFAVSGLRSIASAEGITVSASDLGKTKMVFQVIAIATIALEPRFPLLRIPGDVLLLLVVGFALASASQYFWCFWRRLDSQRHISAPRVLVIQGSERRAEEAKDVAAH